MLFFFLIVLSLVSTFSRFNRIAKKRENLKGPAVNRTPTSHKNGLRRSASPMNGGSQLAPKQPRSVSPIACIADSTNEGSMATNGNHLTVPFSATLNGNGSAVISVDHVRNLSFDHRSSKNFSS